ncbi:hypothetical protein [Bradyrhizobium sp. USDA 4353]
MKMVTGFTALALGYVAVVLAIGLPYWRLTYAELNQGRFAILPGALLLGLLTYVLVVTAAAAPRRIAQVMIATVPSIVIVPIWRHTAVDPTSHNLWPLELVLAVVAGAMVVLPALAIGLGTRWLLARRAAD